MKTKQNRAGFKSYLYFIGNYKIRFALITSSFVVSVIFLTLMPVFIGKLVGALASNPVQSHEAIIFTVVLIILSMGHDVIWHFSEFLAMKFLVPISYQYENVLFHKVISRPYPYFVDKFTGKVSGYIATLSQEMYGFIENVYENYTAQVVSLVAMAIILSSINWQTGVIFVVGLLMMLLVGQQTIKNSFKYEKIKADVQSTKNGKIIDTIANFVNVKSFKKEHVEIKRIQVEQAKTIKSSQTSYSWGIVFWFSMGFIVRFLIWPIAISMNVYLFLHGELTVTELATLLSAILLFSTTIWESVWFISQFNLRRARVEEAHAYLFGSEVIKSFPKTKAKLQFEKSFDHEFLIKNLHFAYPDKPDVPVLTDINLSIAKGEKLGVVGRSGSGKTTLTKLLLDYYEVEPGTIQLDNQDVTSEQIAQLISYVPQDTSLFHRSVAENIAYATERSVTREEIISAAKQAHAHEFIDQISDKYDALVGERGVKLSAGQRQRIAIARAFLDDKPILVMDEATSALDSESEILVQKALEALWDNKTVIAIAHRLSTLRQMDRIIVVDKGRIIEEGSHQALLDKKGHYAKLWAHQSGGFLEE